MDLLPIISGLGNHWLLVLGLVSWKLGSRKNTVNGKAQIISSFSRDGARSEEKSGGSRVLGGSSVGNVLLPKDLVQEALDISVHDVVIHVGQRGGRGGEIPSIGLNVDLSLKSIILAPLEERFDNT